MTIAKNDGIIWISLLNKKKIHHFIVIFKERRGNGQEGKLVFIEECHLIM